MALRLKLKKPLDPELQRLSQLRPPVRLKIYLAKQRRLKAIQDHGKRQELRTDAQKEKDFQEIDESQNAWVEKRIRGIASTWQRWDGMIEEWTPWSLFGEPINQWRYYKKSK